MNQFQAEVYLSGTNFFTLGLGDVQPLRSVGRLLTVLESGTGFAFLALIIGFLPGVSAAFSRRELNIALLDARAGSPPSATELLKRHCLDNRGQELQSLLEEWEKWSAELLESHISFPVLAYFRSQHDNQSSLLVSDCHPRHMLLDHDGNRRCRTTSGTIDFRHGPSCRGRSMQRSRSASSADGSGPLSSGDGGTRPATARARRAFTGQRRGGRSQTARASLDVRAVCERAERTPAHAAAAMGQNRWRKRNWLARVREF